MVSLGTRLLQPYVTISTPNSLVAVEKNPMCHLFERITCYYSHESLIQCILAYSKFTYLNLHLSGPNNIHDILVY